MEFLKEELIWDYRYLNCFWTLKRENLVLKKKIKNQTKKKCKYTTTCLKSKKKREVLIFCNCAKNIGFPMTKMQKSSS